MNEQQKKLIKDFGNYKGIGKYSDHYVKWLEEEVLALRLYSAEENKRPCNCWLNVGSCYCKED